MIIDLQISDTMKIQLTIVINFISSKDIEEERVIYLRSKNIKFMSYNDANEVGSIFYFILYYVLQMS